MSNNIVVQTLHAPHGTPFAPKRKQRHDSRHPSAPPFFTILTPTLQRESLVACCESVADQTYTSWEHLVTADCESGSPELWNRVDHPRRKMFLCGQPHRNFGNTCRHLLWEKAVGQWCIYLDDDNTLAEPTTLANMAIVLEKLPEETKFAIFPIWRHGSWFFRNPPGLCQTDTLNVCVRRDVGQWPDGPEYTMDGIWVESLKAKYPYAAFPEFAPIGAMPKSSLGK